MNIELNKEYLKKDCPYFEVNCPGGSEDPNGLLKLDCTCAKFLAYRDAQNPEVVKKELHEMNITTNEKMDVMLSMQKIFAERFHKIDNLTKDEIDHWTNAYLVCIEDEIVEASEFLDIYLNYHKEFNLKEFRKELIDILHFMMDGMLVGNMRYKDLVECYGKQLNIDLSGVDILDYAIKIEQTYADQVVDENQYLYFLNYLSRDIRLVRQCISWKHWKKPNLEIDEEKLFNAWTEMFRNLIRILLSTGMTSDDIYNVYVQKNIENVLRQKHGYLTGTKK